MPPRPDKLLALSAGQRGMYDSRITQADVASALSFLENTGKIGHGAYLLAMLLYRLDTDVIPSLVRVVRDVAMEKVNAEIGVINRIVRVALVEVCHSTLCHSCNGQGTALIEEKFVTCPTCDGQGWNPMKQSHRARFAGVTRQTWNKIYEDRYQEIYPTLVFWQQSVLCNLKLQFRD